MIKMARVYGDMYVPKDFLPGCGREEKGAGKCQKDRDQQLGKASWLR